MPKKVNKRAGPPGLSSHNAPLHMDFSKMSICTACLEVKGPWRENNSKALQQKCPCNPKPIRRAKAWPSFDFNTAVELCYCCGLELLSSGSRWALFFCDECKKNVVSFNDRYGAYLIPIGRHSLHGGVSVSAKNRVDRRKVEEVEEFVSRWRETVNAMGALSKWSAQIIAANLEAFGFDRKADTPLPEYLAAVARLPQDKDQAFAKLCHFMEHRGEDHSTGEPDPQSAGTVRVLSGREAEFKAALEQIPLELFLSTTVGKIWTPVESSTMPTFADDDSEDSEDDDDDDDDENYEEENDDIGDQLCEFEWDGFPASWAAVFRITLGNSDYVFERGDEPGLGPFLLAKIEPSGGAEVYVKFVPLLIEATCFTRPTNAHNQSSLIPDDLFSELINALPKPESS